MTPELDLCIYFSNESNAFIYTEINFREIPTYYSLIKFCLGHVVDLEVENALKMLKRLQIFLKYHFLFNDNNIGS